MSFRIFTVPIIYLNLTPYLSHFLISEDLVQCLPVRIVNYLEDRIIFDTTLNGCTKKYSAVKSVPQAHVASSTLFIIAMLFAKFVLPNILHSTSETADIVLYSPKTRRHRAPSILQLALLELHL